MATGLNQRFPLLITFIETQGLRGDWNPTPSSGLFSDPWGKQHILVGQNGNMIGVQKPRRKTHATEQPSLGDPTSKLLTGSIDATARRPCDAWPVARCLRTSVAPRPLAGQAILQQPEDHHMSSGQRIWQSNKTWILHI